MAQPHDPNGRPMSEFEAALVQINALIQDYENQNRFASMMGAQVTPDDYDPDWDFALRRFIEALFRKPYEAVMKELADVDLSGMDFSKFNANLPYLPFFDKDIYEKQIAYLDTIMANRGFKRVKDDDLNYLSRLEQALAHNPGIPYIGDLDNEAGPYPITSIIAQPEDILPGSQEKATPPYNSMAFSPYAGRWIDRLSYEREASAGLQGFRVTIEKTPTHLWFMIINSMPYDEKNYFKSAEDIRLGDIDQVLQQYFSSFHQVGE